MSKALMLAPPKAISAIGNTKLVKKTSEKLIQKSPELCLAAGIGAGIGATVMACRATLKVNAVLDVHKKNLANINQVMADKEADPNVWPEYSEEDAQRDKYISTVQCVRDIVKLYLPAIGLGVVSVVLLVGGHKIMKNRLMALNMAYTALTTAYDSYRQRVREEVGEDKERDIYSGKKTVELTETNSKGKEVKKKGQVQTLPMDPYARLFDECNPWWEKDAERNKFFLSMQQSKANDYLNRHGHIFLNDVYRMLGFPPTKEGQLIGWLKDGDGDGFVSFGIWDEVNQPRQEGAALINCYERSVWLTFNVDGVVYDKI